MKCGFTEILLVALIAVAGVGVSVWRVNQRRGLQIESRYRDTVEHTMAEVAAAAGLEWKHTNIRVVVVSGQRINEHGYWVRWVARENAYKAGWSESHRTAAVVVDPETRELPGGLWSVLAHELAHLLMDQHGIPDAEHHGRMRRAGVLWAQL